VLITGSRDWTDAATIQTALSAIYTTWRPHRTEFEQFIVVHGDARGADNIARQWALNTHQNDPWVTHEPHPAQWEDIGRSAGHRRNEEMVNLGADLCLAFPLGRSPGTRGCMKLARKAGISMRQFPPKRGYR